MFYVDGSRIWVRRKGGGAWKETMPLLNLTHLGLEINFLDRKAGFAPRIFFFGGPGPGQSSRVAPLNNQPLPMLAKVFRAESSLELPHAAGDA